MTTEKQADTIYFGGTIITMDDDRPEVEAIAVADGRIIATGNGTTSCAPRPTAPGLSTWAARR